MNSMSWLVFKKEMRDLFRDRKAFLGAVLLPIFILPFILYIIGGSAASNTNAVKDGLRIAIVGNQNSSLEQALEQVNGIQIINVSNPEQALKDNEIYLYLDIPNNFNSAIASKDGSANLKIYYDNTSQKSQIALSTLEEVISGFSKQTVSNRLSSLGVDNNLLNPINIEPVGVGIQNENEAHSLQLIAMLLPMFVLAYAAQGGAAAATDLAAGEKERGSLEPLLSTRASRSSILIGKLAAITLMGILSTLSGFIGVLVSMFIPNSLFMNTDGLALSPKAIIIIAALAILITLSFSALQLAISVFAKSFKEAQTYLGFLTFAPMIVSYGTMYLDSTGSSLLLYNIPIINAVLVMKEAIFGVFVPMHLILTFTWSIVYIILAVLLARYMFNREDALFRS
ncbi:ABC transporter permease [Clostridium mediterraneense]|uniref:ABC transporter permease n=1 Tax=Clostridium mediterraneense TaxID=1805472 RepID=UPI00082BA04F|nr:ABC transporter permease [Clostridium mediterraneense]